MSTWTVGRRRWKLRGCYLYIYDADTPSPTWELRASPGGETPDLSFAGDLPLPGPVRSATQLAGARLVAYDSALEDEPWTFGGEAHTLTPLEELEFEVLSASNGRLELFMEAPAEAISLDSDDERDVQLTLEVLASVVLESEEA